MKQSDKNRLQIAYIGYHSPWNSKEQREYYYREIKRLSVKYNEKD